MRAGLILAPAILVSLVLSWIPPANVPHDAGSPASVEEPLPKIAPAPGFRLTSQDAVQVSLSDFRGKVAAVSFFYTLCTATCPVLTPLLSMVQDQLGGDFGTKIAFLSVTLDPERDTPQALKLYAQAYGADLGGWTFLTGPPAAIADLASRYGVFAAKSANGSVDHSFLTSIVDRQGILRVQYSGVRFDPDEFRRDLIRLTRER